MADAFSDKNLPSGVYMVNTPLGRVRSDAVFKGTSWNTEGSVLKADQLARKPTYDGAQGYKWDAWNNIYNWGPNSDESWALDTSQKFETAAPAPAPSEGGGGGGSRSALTAPQAPALKEVLDPITPAEKAEVTKPAKGLESTIKTSPLLLRERRKRSYLTRADDNKRKSYLTSGG
jgi:hypothetical protein